MGLLPARPGVGPRPCSRWVTRAERPVLPQRPARPRLWRLVKTPQDWPQLCVAAPTVRGVRAPYGSALLPPRRAGRRPHQRGRTGLSQHRGIVGGNLWLGLQQGGWGAGGAGAPAPVAAPTWQWLMQQFDGRRLG